jgi:hypothetical protein
MQKEGWLPYWGGIIGLIGGIVGTLSIGISLYDRLFPPSVDVVEVRPVYVYAADTRYPPESVGRKFYQEYFSALIRLRSKSRPVSVSGMEISGRIFLNFSEWFGYSQWLDSKGHSGDPDLIEKARTEQQPYYNVSFGGWISDSKLPLQIDPYQEHYIRFDFSTANDTPTGIPIEPAYLGTANPPKIPEVARVRPHPSDIFELGSGVAGPQRELLGLRSETSNWHLKWYLILGSRRILIPSVKIRGFAKVSQEEWSTKPPRLLFSVASPKIMPF